MTAAPGQYLGKEQSYIKHCFLTRYLKIAAYKILQGRSRIFNYVDAFAGPWRTADKDDYSDASFHQAVQTLESVRADLGIRGLEGLRVRSFFCEKRPDAARVLQGYAKRHRRLNIHVFQGSYEDHLQQIEEDCSDGFTFTFIDPTGWNIDSGAILSHLARLKGEYLLNFMAEDINRYAEYSAVTASFGRFLADPDWQSDYERLPSDWTNEERIMFLLQRRMKETEAATYLPAITIKRPRMNRIKMRLMLGTHSTFGVDVFRDVQASVEKEEMAIRTSLRQERAERPRLFTDVYLAEVQQELRGVGCPPCQTTASRVMTQALGECKDMSFRDLAVRTLEAVPIRKTQIKKLLGELKVQRVVDFDLPERKRVPQEDTRIRLRDRDT